MNFRLPIFVLLFVTPWLQVSAQDTSEKRQQLKEIRSQIEQSVKHIQQAEIDKKDIQADLMQAEKEISYIGRRLHIIRKDYELQETRWRELQSVKVAREEALDVSNGAWASYFAPPIKSIATVMSVLF